MIAITSGSSSISSSSTRTSSSSFCTSAKDANPGATVLKKALVKKGAFLLFPFGIGLPKRGLLGDEKEGWGVCSVVDCLVEVEGSCASGERARGFFFVSLVWGSLAWTCFCLVDVSVLSSTDSNAALQKRRRNQKEYYRWRISLLFHLPSIYSTFSLVWPVVMQIYCNNWKFLYNKNALKSSVSLASSEIR